MKLLKAYIRTFMVDAVIHALKTIGAPRLTAIDVRALGDEIAPDKLNISAKLGSTYTTMVKLELVCNDKCVEEAVKVIQKEARTGRKGDGIIVISPIEQAIKIRTGRKGEKSIINCNGKTK
ncbi:MAG: P-II family nitrogen regulator [Omnitrophica bacterium]|nr:P-II family nitrogen regulator [Candidatus Omnitrophota bacterium]